MQRPASASACTTAPAATAAGHPHRPARRIRPRPRSPPPPPSSNASFVGSTNSTPNSSGGFPPPRQARPPALSIAAALVLSLCVGAAAAAASASGSTPSAALTLTSPSVFSLSGSLRLQRGSDRNRSCGSSGGRVAAASSSSSAEAFVSTPTAAAARGGLSPPRGGRRNSDAIFSTSVGVYGGGVGVGVGGRGRGEYFPDDHAAHCRGGTMRSTSSARGVSASLLSPPQPQQSSPPSAPPGRDSCSAAAIKMASVGGEVRGEQRQVPRIGRMRTRTREEDEITTGTASSDGNRSYKGSGGVDGGAGEPWSRGWGPDVDAMVSTNAVRLEELARAGKPTAGARASEKMRRACGDPAFFEDLRRTFDGQSGGRFLTHEQEMWLGTRVQRYRALVEELDLMEKNLGRQPTQEERLTACGLSDVDYREVMIEGMEARQRLVVANLALVVSLSNKYKRSHRDCGCLQTLIQEGTLGLIRAAERYDPTKGFRFTTYAIWWIEAKLRISVQTEERLIHVPMWVKNKHKVVSRSIPPLRDALGREPTPSELADQVFVDTNSKISITPERVRQLNYWVALQKHQVSLDMNMKQTNSAGDEIFTKQSSLAADDPSAEVTSETEILRKFLESCMSQDLTNVQKEIVRMRVGLRGGKRSTRKEISRTLNISLKNVVHQERKAFTKLGVVRTRGDGAWRDFN